MLDDFRCLEALGIEKQCEIMQQLKDRGMGSYDLYTITPIPHEFKFRMRFYKGKKVEEFYISFKDYVNKDSCYAELRKTFKGEHRTVAMAYYNHLRHLKEKYNVLYKDIY